MGYSVVNVDELEAGGRTGVVKFVRRALGLEAFGLNWFELPPDTEGHEHDEVESQQEEVNVVVRGGGIWRVDGEEVPVREGSILRFDPEATRCPVAGPDGMAFLAIGVAARRRTRRGARSDRAHPHLVAVRLEDVPRRAARAPAGAARRRPLDLERRARAARARRVRRRAPRPRRGAAADRQGAGGRRGVRRRVTRGRLGGAACGRPRAALLARRLFAVVQLGWLEHGQLADLPVYQHYAALMRAGHGCPTATSGSSTRRRRCPPSSCPRTCRGATATSFAVAHGRCAALAACSPG